MNRYQLETMRLGVAQELADATDKLSTMYMDINTEKDAREKQRVAVSDLKERLEGINTQIKAMDEEAERKLKKTSVQTAEPGDMVVKQKAELYRSTMENRQMDIAMKSALLDNSATGGDKFLPKTVADSIITEPRARNPLRGISDMTAIENLELPRISFTLDDDDFIEDGETAKELKARGDTVAFGRNKFKVFVDISETVLNGTDTNLVQVIEGGLESGLAKKEKKVAFAAAPKTGEDHMSFYAKDGSDYLIKAVGGNTKYKAIIKALADLEEDYREVASIVMTYSDYIDILEDLANGSTTLYGVQPEQVLGKPVVFCDSATIPIVGDFSYSHYNYAPGMLYERDKNIKTGLESFVLTAWFDSQIKLRSAFRLATVNP